MTCFSKLLNHVQYTSVIFWSRPSPAKEKKQLSQHFAHLAVNEESIYNLQTRCGAPAGDVSQCAVVEGLSFYKWLCQFLRVNFALNDLEYVLHIAMEHGPFGSPISPLKPPFWLYLIAIAIPIVQANIPTAVAWFHIHILSSHDPAKCPPLTSRIANASVLGALAARMEPWRDGSSTM